MVFILHAGLYVFVSVVVSWVIAHLFKPILNKEISWNNFFMMDGHMPSAHTAPAAALSFAILFSEGFSTVFVFSVVFLIALMRDAVSVRFAVGQNALVLKESLSSKKLKDRVLIKEGHKPKEVFASLLIGLIVAALFLLVF